MGVIGRGIAFALLSACAVCAQEAPAERYPGSEVDKRFIKLISRKSPTTTEEVVDMIENEGANPSHLGEYNYTGLMWSIVRKKPDILKLLLKYGADTEPINAWGRNAMFLAAWENDAAATESLLAAGANASASAQHDGWNALHKSCESGAVGLVKLLLDAGALALLASRRPPPGPSS